MEGPFELQRAKLDGLVTRTAPGTFILASEREGVEYVGRSDDDVKAGIAEWLGEYEFFQFEYAETAEAAFERECDVWHRYGGPLGKLDNLDHPARPAGAAWLCPRCSVFD